MKYLLSLLITVFTAFYSPAQTPVTLSKQKVNWKNYPEIFKDKQKKEFIDKFSFLSGVEMYEITYLSDGLKIKAFMAVPEKSGTYPAIIYNRGGNRNFGALQLFRGQWKFPAAYYFSKIAAGGYVVIGCNYRGSGGSEGMEEFGGADVNDVLNLIKVLKEEKKADPEKIGMYGWSRGGMMTYLSLLKTNEIDAVAVGGAVSDLTFNDRPEMEKNVFSELIPGYWNKKEEALKERSAIHRVAEFPKNVPILILHGNADWRVKSTQALQLALEFEKHRIPYRLKIFEGADHGISEFREEVNKDVLDWFNRFLKNNEPLPDMKFHGR